jgi:hypothetical protein
MRDISHQFPKYQLQCLNKDGTNSLGHRTKDPEEGNTLQGKTCYFVAEDGSWLEP